MPAPKLNAKAPPFLGECTGNKVVSLSDLKGKNVVCTFIEKIAHQVILPKDKILET